MQSKSCSVYQVLSNDIKKLIDPGPDGLPGGSIMFRYKSISVTCLLVTILFGHEEQQLIILSCSIEKYQEIGPWTLWLAW